MSARSVVATITTIIGIVVGLGLMLIGLGWAYPGHPDPTDVSIGELIAKSYAWTVAIGGAIILAVSIAVAVVRSRARRAKQGSTASAMSLAGDLPEARVHRRLSDDRNGK